jgi:O-antigen/teichoic acid export membrane protein
VQPLARVVARNSALGFAAQLAMKLLSFGFTVLIVRNLGADAYGQYAAVLAFGAVFVFLADCGLSPYVVREVARLRETGDNQQQIAGLYRNVLGLRTVLGVLTAAIVIASAWLSGRPPVMIGAIALGTVGLLMYAYEGSSEAILAGFERLDITAGAKVLNQAAFVLVGAAMLLIGIGYYGLVVANLVGVLLMTIVCWRAVRRLGVVPARICIREWLPLIRSSLPFGVIALTLGLSYRFDSVLLNVYRGDAETGYYNAAYNLVFSAVLISNVLNTSLYPSLVRRASAMADGLTAAYERSLTYLFLLSLPIAVGCWAAADQVVPALFGSAYQPSVMALRILIWVVPFMFASEFLGYVVVIQGQERRVARAVLVSTTLNVAVNFILVPRWGLIGAAVMTLITEAVLVSQYVWLLRSLLRQFVWRRVLLGPLLAAGGMGLVVLLLRDAPLVATCLVAGLGYVGMLVALRLIGPDELRFLRSLHGSKVSQKALAA